MILEEMAEDPADDGARVICGPGENACIVDIGDGLTVIFKMKP
jgi:phosphoribosylformylglycinamidine (FGAM) synthase-like enzyme